MKLDFFNSFLFIPGTYIIEIANNDRSANAPHNVKLETDDEHEVELQCEEQTVEHPQLNTRHIKYQFSTEKTARITFTAESDTEWTIESLTMKENETHYRSEFYNFHFSLKDHVEKLDRVLSLKNSKEDLGILFRLLRADIGRTQNRLTEEITKRNAN